MNKDRLTLLKKVLNKHHDNGIRFNISCWILKDDRKDDWCGTTVCALGLASTIEEFQKQGLYNDGSNVIYVYFDCSGENPEEIIESGFYAASSFFDIGIKDAKFLFSPDHYKGNVTAKTVARRIGRYIKTEGKSAQRSKFYERY